MGKRANLILNEYYARDLLKRDTLDLDKFYNGDLKLFVNVSRQENKQLKDQLQQKENIIKEVRESAKRELKIAEENIKNSEQWLDVEEEQDHAKRDIHTGKIVKRYMEMFLEILDKVD